jgi:hypothetical protein
MNKLKNMTRRKRQKYAIKRQIVKLEKIIRGEK